MKHAEHHVVNMNELDHVIVNISSQMTSDVFNHWLC